LALNSDDFGSDYKIVTPDKLRKAQRDPGSIPQNVPL
jgi:hypothetical protein